ncbi:DNA-binding transcriptional LysR family regulator [Allocatelliglobosispora scoriae]|uniref:DNA-binding transcriptional LysR family regulator n=1 Tax=Allocatelliglobosispora scoriae TaxID=643052 RepID=A0A841BNM6_9ACTN|nr:LysR family transcriptional regulator [Allocatelliglobosispora scoriae]MBB5868342.1 DNA-binding transcriptional LysR family regulator [Allocatelliglobosispora scoriae]
MDLEIRHLRVLRAIADTGSVTKAASLLGLAQPAVTAQLQRIERALGGPLFDRDRRGATPTALGELVLARARVVLPAMKGLQEDAAQLAGHRSRPTQWRIGAVNGPILGGLISRLASLEDSLEVLTHPSHWADKLAEMAAERKLDFCIVGVCGDTIPGPAESGLVWREIATDAIFVMLPETHPLARRWEIDLAELSDAQWASMPGDGCFGDCFAAACARSGFSPRTMYEMDFGNAIDVVLAGHAVGLCKATFRRVDGVATVPIAGGPLRWRHLLGWHPRSEAARFAETMHTHAAAAYEESADRNPHYIEWRKAYPQFGPGVPSHDDMTKIISI